MRRKVREKERATELRRKGYSYNEILAIVPVSRSSLSLWLSALPLTESERRYLKKRKDSNISKGRIRAASAHRENRRAKDELLRQEARQEFAQLKAEPLFQVGISLYWAEGAKRSSVFQFMNSDPGMVQVMLRWLETYAERDRNDMRYRLFTHKAFAHEKCELFWCEKLGVSPEAFLRTIYKPSELLVKKRPNYRGCLRVEVPRSTGLLRKMIVWQDELSKEYSS